MFTDMPFVKAVQDAFALIKAIKETSDKKVINAATGSLYEKITELQMLNAELANLFQAEKRLTIQLRKEKEKGDLFITQSEKYEIVVTDGGSTVYRSKKSADTNNPFHHLCAHCYGNSIISILQPDTEKHMNAGFFIHCCPFCKQKFRMNAVPSHDSSYLAGE